MMLGWSPPLTMMPWTRASGRSCWRIWSSATKSWMTAFSAFTPRHGHDEAWVALPWNSAFTLMMPSVGRHTCVPPRPWIIIAASTSRKTPASIRRTLPAPPSSAGVPITWMRPANGIRPRATASAAPAPLPGGAAAVWPRPGPRAGRRDDVVAARVTDGRKGVVFGQDGDGGPGAGPIDRRPKRRRQPADGALDLGTVLLEELGEPGMSLLFLEAQPRFAGDPGGELFEVVRQPVHRARDLVLGACDRV